MTNLLRTRIAARASAIILLIVGTVGLVFLAVAIPVTQQREEAKQQVRLNQLVDTVERTVAIACFLGDATLADEVARGLLNNPIVREVAIDAGGLKLVRRDRTGVISREGPQSGLPVGALARNIVSPFGPRETVGRIVVVSDPAQIRNSVAAASWYTATLVVVLLSFTGFGVTAVVYRLITRPITKISSRMHELQAEIGQKLEVPRGNEANEIGQLVRDVNALLDYLLNILNDEHRLRIEREVEERKFRAIFEHADTAIFLLDEQGRLVSCNSAFVNFFALPEAPRDGTLWSFADLMGTQRERAQSLIDRAMLGQQSVGEDIRLEGAPGAPTRWANVVLTPVESGRLQGVVNDITERKRAEEAAHALAMTDRLTGIANRLGFERKLERMIDECYRDPSHRFALLMMDLDWFKQVNDSYGHKAGDEVLVRVARTLEDATRKTDFVARLGGDEFVVLLDSTTERNVIERIAGKIISDVSSPIPVSAGAHVRVGASIGIAIFGGEAMTKDELVARADQAMYEAKQAGRNTHRFYAPAALPISDTVATSELLAH